jgi:hypothetical protein
MIVSHYAPQTNENFERKQLQKEIESDIETCRFPVNICKT